MSFRSFLVPSVFCGALFLGSVANAQTRSFEDLVNYACETHPSIAVANVNILQANTRISEAKALYLPSIRSVSEIGISEDELPDRQGVSGARPYSTQLILDQPLYIGGRAKNEVASARLTKEGLYYQGISQVIDIQSRAVFSYIELGRTLSVLRVRQDNLKALQSQKSDAERRFELGGGTKSNIVEVASRIARAEGNLITARADVNAAKIALGEATGLAVEEPVALPRGGSVEVLSESIVASALSKNPQIKVADKQISIADAGIERARSDRRPQLRLVGELNAQRDTSFFGFERDEARLRLRLDVPIFEGGRLAAREKGALYEASRTRYDKVALTRRVIEQLQSERDRYLEAKKLIVVNESLVLASEQALSAITREAFEGFRPNRDVLDAQQELLEAQLRLEQSRFTSTLASFRLQFSVGEIDQDRFPACASAILENPDAVADNVDENSYKLDLPILGDLIGGETDRRRRGPPNRR
jgi:outer membrane protein